jgi:peptide/nickel transport system substrate-binding protein
VRVRQAVRYLIDYDGMVNSFLKGTMVVHQTFWASGFWAALDENMYKLDVDKAKSLLKDAGYPDGFEVTLDVPTSSPFPNMGQSVQATLAQGGIKANIVQAETKAVITKYRARQHDMVLLYWGPDYMDPHTNADGFANNPDNSDNAKGKPLAWRNSWYDETVNKMTADAVRERDTAKREQMYKDLQKKVMEEGPFIIMFQNTVQLAERAGVKGFVHGPSNDVVYYNLTTK